MVTVHILVYKVHGQDTIMMEYIISMYFTEVQQNSPLLIVNMTTEIITTLLVCYDVTTILYSYHNQSLEYHLVQPQKDFKNVSVCTNETNFLLLY